MYLIVNADGEPHQVAKLPSGEDLAGFEDEQLLVRVSAQGNFEMAIVECESVCINEDREEDEDEEFEDQYSILEWRAV